MASSSERVNERTTGVTWGNVMLSKRSASVVHLALCQFSWSFQRWESRECQSASNRERAVQTQGCRRDGKTGIRVRENGVGGRSGLETG
eukprot:g9975.t1